jgi:hypothetical protein
MTRMEARCKLTEAADPRPRLTVKEARLRLRRERLSWYGPQTMEERYQQLHRMR